MKCGKCKQKDVQVIDCDLCSMSLCSDCHGLTNLESKVMNIQDSRTLIFHCQECRENDIFKWVKELILTKDDLLASKDKIINLQDAEIMRLKQEKDHLTTDKPTTYSGIVAGIARPKPTTVPPIILKHINPTKRIAAQKVKELINTTSSVKVDKLIVKDDKIILKCCNNAEIAGVKSLVEKQWGRKIVATVPKLRNPRVKILDIDPELTNEEIKSQLLDRNNLKDPKYSLHIRHVYPTKKRGKIAIVEANKETYSTLMSTKIFIGSNSCPIIDDPNVSICKKCCGFNHGHTKCAKPNICYKCSGSHEGRSCTKDLKQCHNCISANAKYKKDYNTEHNATDYKNCPSYRGMLSFCLKSTDYPSPPEHLLQAVAGKQQTRIQS